MYHPSHSTIFREHFLQACCTCRVRDITVTGSPSIGSCEDKTGPQGQEWTDFDGLDCDYYERNDKCEVDGDSFENHGMTANQVSIVLVSFQVNS